MTINQTEAPVVETPEGQVEAPESQGVVEQTVESPEQGTETPLQSPSEDAQEQEAEASLFQTLKAQKGWQSEEDLAKAYKEAEAELTRRSQALKSSTEEMEAMEAVIDGLLSGDITEDQLIDQPQYGRPTTPDPVIREVREMKAKMDVQSFANKYDDFAELQPLMSDILANTPEQHRSMFEGVKGLELLRKMAKADYMEQEVASAEKKGKQSLTLKEVEKTRATVADGTKAKPSGEKVFSKADIDAMPLDEFIAKRDIIEDQQRRGLLR
jgi:hypothetical protein